jgi:predicted phage terminase large subunit-like protein
MLEEAYTVTIGRLREGGEQGWLSATFTPRGRKHWTYEVFATGRPDTALFRSRTGDNPFLPTGFQDTLARQYTSTLAAQELEGEFLDSGGFLFNPHWLEIVDRVPEMKAKVRAWDMAATPLNEERAKDPDYTAGVLIGKDAAGLLYILDARRMRGTPNEVERFITSTAREDGRDTQIWMEQEPGSAGVTVVDHYRRRVLHGYNFHAERATGSKADRALPMAAQAEGGIIKLLRGAWNKDFLDELELFPLFCRHDDQVDACTLAHERLQTMQTDFSQIASPDSPQSNILERSGYRFTRGSRDRIWGTRR